MNNVIVKTALKTLLVLIIAAILAFGVASLGFPAHMATLFENMRAYNFAAGYAGLAYSYSGTIEDLSRCVDDSILAGDRRNVINYGEQLVAHNDFLSYAGARTEGEREKLPENLKDSYDYYLTVYGNLTVAKYGQGDKAGALETAKAAMNNLEGFPVNNPLAVLAVYAAINSDNEFSEQLYGAVSSVSPTAEQQSYYESVIEILT